MATHANTIRPKTAEPPSAAAAGDAYEVFMTRALDAASKIPTSAPTVAALGAHLADVERALEAYGVDYFPENGPDAISAQYAREILYERADGLRLVIGTMQAATMADAAIQIALIPYHSERISSLNGAASEAAGTVIDRMAYPVLPIVAAAANLDIHGMGWEDLERLRVSRFTGVGVQS